MAAHRDIVSGYLYAEREVRQLQQREALMHMLDMLQRGLD